MYLPSRQQTLSVFLLKWIVEEKETVSVRVGWAVLREQPRFKCHR